MLIELSRKDMISIVNDCLVALIGVAEFDGKVKVKKFNWKKMKSEYVVVDWCSHYDYTTIKPANLHNQFRELKRIIDATTDSKFCMNIEQYRNMLNLSQGLPYNENLIF